MKVIILSGIPGAGKSHWIEHSGLIGPTCSADHYLPKDPQPKDFGIAHAKCYYKYVRCLEEREDVIFVDNTNLNAWEIAPYVLAADAYGHAHEIIRIKVPASVAWERQQHRVPLETFCHMVANFNKRDVLPWWNVRVVE